MRTFYATRVLALGFTFVVLTSNWLFAPPPPDITKLVKATIEVQKIEPERPVEGQVSRLYFTLTNHTQAPISGWVSARFTGVPSNISDKEVRISDLAPKSSVSDVVSITTPNVGESSEVKIFFYNKVFIKNMGFKKNLITEAALDVDIATAYITKRISGSSYFSFSKGDSRDSFADNNGYLVVNHDPGCGIVGNDGTDRFFVNRPLPAGATIERMDFRQFWPTERGCGDPWSWLDDAGSYDASVNPTMHSIRWHNACRGAYARKNIVYIVSFLVNMPVHSDIGEPVYDPIANTPAVPGGFALTEIDEPSQCSGYTNIGYNTTAAIPLIDGPYTTPGTIHARQVFTVTYDICNATATGGMDLPSFDAALYVDGVAENDTKTISKLSPQKCQGIQWNITKELTAGTHALDLKQGSDSLSHALFTVQ